MKKYRLLHFCLIPLIIAGVVGTLIYNKYTIEAMGVILIYSIYITINLYIYWIKDKNVKKITNYIDNSISKQFFNMISPVALIKESGEIVWSNNRFKEISKSEEVVSKNVLSIINNINLENIVNSNYTVHQKIKINGDYYDIQGSKLIDEKNKYIILYFNNINELLTIEGVRESVVLLEVDNLSDVLDSTDESNRPLVVAEIERTLNSYANDNKAMIKKYDSSKYVLTMQDRFITNQIDNNFPILNTISNIEKGNGIEITISMGIGRGGLTPSDNSNYANTAIELALGRGGDQIVIKSGEEIKFFGGNSKEVEKRTRVRARVVSHALKDLIYESDKVYIIGHENPDMDCFGSAVALSSMIKQLGKNCQIVLNNDVKAIEYFLDKISKSERYKNRFIITEEADRELTEETLIIVVDVHNRSYVSSLDLVEKAKKKVIIDHHRRSPDIITGTILNYIEVYASSTSEMVTEIIQYMSDKPNITTEEAEGLLAGIFMDTKGFSFKTGVRTFEAASFLKGIGADTIEVKKMFTDNLEDYLLIADTIKSAEVDEEKSCAIAVCPHEVNSVIIAKSADELLNISGIRVSFVLGVIDDAVYISGRSVGDINVQVVLEALGGGGHMNIAGTKLTEVSLDEAIVELKDKINKYLKVGE